MTIYVVTSGQYSNYHIVAVFTDPALAEAFVEQFDRQSRWDKAEIEEWKSDRPFTRVPPGMTHYRVMAPDDDPEGDPHWWANPWTLDDEDDTVSDVPSRQPHTGNWRMLVIAPDKTHAIKIATERLAQHRMELERDGATT